MAEGNVFSLSTLGGGGGGGGGVPRSGPDGVWGYPKVPTPCQGRYPPPSQFQMVGGGTPRNLPPAKVGTQPPARSGQGEGYPKVPIPTLWDRTAYGVLDTPQSVCLLHSRRTFLSY